MDIYLNDKKVTLPSGVSSVEDIVRWKDLPPTSTAIAVNNKIVRRDRWASVHVDPLDRVTVISAAFGG